MELKLTYNNKAKDPTYYMQKSVRQAGKSTSVTIEIIGKHSELLRITDDPLAYAKEHVRKATEDEKKGIAEITFKINERLKNQYKPGPDTIDRRLNIGYFILQKIYSDLKLKDFWENIPRNPRMKLDCNEYSRFLTFARVLFPGSKLSTIKNLINFYEQPDLKYYTALRFMDVLARHFQSYIEHLFKHSRAIFPVSTSVCYFDCTNFYFEIEHADPDWVDPVTGAITRALRKYGHSKQHQPAPIVQMGLFVDKHGIPLSMCIDPGNAGEAPSAIPCEKQLISMFKNKKFIYCADAGLGSLKIRQFNDMGGRAFVVTQSIKKLSEILQEAVFNDYDYKLLSNNKPVTIAAMKSFDHTNEAYSGLFDDVAYKELIADRAVDVGLTELQVLANGGVREVKSKAQLHQKIVVTFSRKLMEYQRYIRNNQIERARELLARSTKPEDIKKGDHDVRRFIKRRSEAKLKKGKKNTPAAADSAKISTRDIDVVDRYFIDEEKIAEEEKYDGYYAVATNLSDPAKDILEVSHGRYIIEECFRLLKTDFKSRPAYHSKDVRIKAHFIICYTALLIHNLLQNMLDKNKDHFTQCQIIDALKKMSVSDVGNAYYNTQYYESDVTIAFERLFRLGIDKRFYRKGSLEKILKKIMKGKI